MKRCPTCSETYADDTMSFCLSDGAPLILVTAGPPSSQATLVAPGPLSPDTSPQRPPITNPAYANQSAPNWTQPTMPQYGVPPGQQRSLLPWILAGAALLGLAVVGIAAIALLVLSSSGSNRNASRAYSPGNSNTRSNRNGSSNNSNSAATNYSARKGRYTGTATNTTNTPPATGDAQVDITEISDTTGAMKMRMSFTNGLCGEGDSFGVLNKSTGEVSLFGSLTSGGGDCPTATWVITTRCTFSDEETLKCTYRLTSAGLTPQAGRFEVTK